MFLVVASFFDTALRARVQNYMSSMIQELAVNETWLVFPRNLADYLTPVQH
uniref:Uncharacterized protein n=1 Tax=Physcomitrium patens TaxID=3218 RepID=A0A2K1IEA4_PHYPA|nr:hypothetical protein PHYPA_029763 [Physcomitrium patens]